ncbi:hypothetical protein DEO72_LG5g2777 [Vigna unguiculata]|nr:hypothetical protein DEO72_LG5g2777 [Vigna unguiculata]
MGSNNPTKDEEDKDNNVYFLKNDDRNLIIRSRKYQSCSQFHICNFIIYLLSLDEKKKGISEVQLIMKTLMNNSPVEPHHYKYLNMLQYVCRKDEESR